MITQDRVLSRRSRVDCEHTTDYRSRISCLNLTSLFALFLFLQSTLQRQL
jgi:hypothetical protein